MSAIDRAIKELSARHADDMLNQAAREESYAVDGNPDRIFDHVWPKHAAMKRQIAGHRAKETFQKALAAEEAARS